MKEVGTNYPSGLLYLAAILIVLVFTSCRQDSCPEGYQKLDKVAAEKMKSLRIGAFQRGGEYRDARFFELLTGEKMHMYLGDITFYQSFPKFEQDEKQWNKWLNENRCTISDEQVDSLILEVIKNTPWISDH